VQAALKLLGGVGYEKIARHISGLSKAFTEGAQALKIKIKTPADSVGPLVVLQMKDSNAVVKKLATRNIVASNRMDGLRVSFHLYNTLEDVRSVLDVLNENLHLAVRE
jgi:selenocysteine lyase/cysteine desulfurase